MIPTAGHEGIRRIVRALPARRAVWPNRLVGLASGWSLPMHGIAVLTAWALASIAGAAWPLALGAGLSFLGLIVGAWGAWTASGRWGPANAITLLRLCMLLGLLAASGEIAVAVLWAGMSAVFALDAVDGFVARRSGCASAFGATLDMEVDALFVLGVGYLLHVRGMAAWVLLPGVLRYVYVIALALAPASGIDRKRSRLGRWAFLVTGLGLLAAWLLPTPANTLAAALATAVSCASFGRSFSEAYPGLGRLPRRLLVASRRAWNGMNRQSGENVGR